MRICQICQTTTPYENICPICGKTITIEIDVNPTLQEKAIDVKSALQEPVIPFAKYTKKRGKKLTFYSPLNIVDGYGGTAIDIMKEFLNQDIDFNYRNIVHNKPDGIDREFLEYIYTNHNFNSDVVILYCQPTTYPFVKEPYKKIVSMTMFETTKIPDHWIPFMNKFDLILTPSKFCKDVFKKCGVNTRIAVLPFGINPERYKYKTPVKKDKFVFLTTNAFAWRKNVKELAIAFLEEFKNDENVELWIKTKPEHDLGHIADERLKVIRQNLDFDQYIELYEKCDCFIFPSKGEGIGMPPQEAMAIGRPVIATDWGGMKEFMNPKWSYPLKIEGLEKALDYPIFMKDIGMYATIDRPHLQKLMRYVFENREEAYKKGKLASEYILKNRTWQKVVEKMIKEIEKLGIKL